MASKTFKVKLIRDGYNLIPSLLTHVFNITFKSRNNMQDYNRAESFSYRRKVYKIVLANIVWFTRSELILKILPKLLIRLLYKKQCKHIESKRGLMDLVPDDAILIIPGGILSVSATYVLLAEERGLLYYTYDSGVDGEILFGKQSIAAHLRDVEKYDLSSLSKRQRLKLKEEALTLISQRINGTDRYSFQKIKGSNDIHFCSRSPSQNTILVPLTCPWDAASLNRKDRFTGEINFLRWIISNFASYHVIVRIHPIERHRFAQRYDNLRQIFRNVPNLEIISGDADVNSYDLLSDIDFMVCRNTSLGAEAHLLGVPVYSTTLNYWNDGTNLTETKINKDDIHIRYVLAQKYNYVFPECNLSNVRHKIDEMPNFDLFSRMIENRVSMIEEVLSDAQ